MCQVFLIIIKIIELYDVTKQFILFFRYYAVAPFSIGIYEMDGSIFFYLFMYNKLKSKCSRDTILLKLS